MIASSIYTELAADRQRNLIAAADAHRLGRLARSGHGSQRSEATAPRSMRTFVRSILPSLHA